MMLFRDGVEKLKNSIDDLLDLRNRYKVSKELEEFENYLTLSNESCQEKLTFINMFFNEQVKIGELPNNAKIREIINKISARFNEKAERQSLVKGNDWARLSKELQEFFKQVDNKLAAAWTEFCKKQFDGQTPTDLNNNIIQTDQNKVLIQQYQLKFRDFDFMRNNRPTDDTEFLKVRQGAKELKEILSKIDFEVPEAIKQFIDAINLYGSASLDLFTEDVKTWLIKQGTIHNFKVVRK